MGMELLRCKTPEMVEKEIAVHVLAYNLNPASPKNRAASPVFYSRIL
jgi:hypothetical protein